MKALSIKQPWASLIVGGFKDIENRSWPTKYRGIILVHAPAKPDHRTIIMKGDWGDVNYAPCFTEQQRARIDYIRFYELSRLSPSIFLPNFSAIVGEVEIVGCIENSTSIWAEPGQWHWQLANARLYDNPILNVKGSLSLWEYKHKP